MLNDAPRWLQFVTFAIYQSWIDGNLQANVWGVLSHRIMSFLESRYAWICVLLIGLACSGFTLAAYAPADGADSNDYYLYAAYIAGIDLPEIAASVKPMYPLFIAINRYVLHNFDLIWVWQVFFAAIRGILVFGAIKRYHPILGFACAIVVVCDMQVNYTFVQVATEPLYIFLLITAFCVLMRANPAQIRYWWWDVLLCVLLVFLIETRTVARLLWLPLLLVFAIKVRDVKRLAVVLGLFAITFFSFQLVLHGLNATMLVNENEKMLIRPLAELDLLDRSVGDANEQIVGILQDCQEQQSNSTQVNCLFTDPEQAATNSQLLRDSYLEAFTQHAERLIPKIARHYIAFLRMSGLQHIGDPSPADVQCANVAERAQRNSDTYLLHEWQALTIPPTQSDNIQDQIHQFTRQMCPPLPTSDQLQHLFDQVAIFYNILAPSDPHILYGMLLFVVTIIPWMRRYWLLTVTAFGIVTYHALVSAVLSNVQARYAVVINPFRAILMTTSLFLFAYWIINLIDKGLLFFQHRKQK